ncbi:MAG: carboxylate-amine ligase [Methylobacteriaceae bacterium]|nr:carboxylate-amine ligase [Methylobacteriaceae bacterium]
MTDGTSARTAAGDERARFARLQQRLRDTFPSLQADPNAPRVVVIAPSLTLDPDILARVAGVHHYEERMLCLLLLLKMPRTRLLYLTSAPIPESIIDYYLHLLPGVPTRHARRRLELFSCDDASAQPLTEKILARPRLIARIREAIGDPAQAHLTCFNVTGAERRLALALDVPVYGCDPDLAAWGGKSGSRRIFRAVGLDLPDGAEDLRDEIDMAGAIADLKLRNPALRRAVVKLDEGFSGEGNAVLRYDGAPEGAALQGWARDALPRLAFEAARMDWETYRAKFAAMGGIVEAFVEGEDKRSPSAQLRVDPAGRVEAISTHDQVLGGANGQIFLGARFPAEPGYRLDIQTAGLVVARALADKGALGRFGVDFLTVRAPQGWRSLAIEINLRKGGTTHPFLMLQYLTGGAYDAASGGFATPAGEPRCYYATDNLESPSYRGLTPDDLIDIAALNGLHFDAATQQGVVFHLIGALSEFGKLGLVAIAPDQARADALHRRAVAVLDHECGAG